eukprot:scaffold7553_cov77-Isochrysis_galbana.AAC.1
MLDAHASEHSPLGLSLPANDGPEGLDRAAAVAARARLYGECRADCLNTLVSVLHERRQMAKLARLPFEGQLRMHLVDTLRRHAPNSDVMHTAQGATVYEVLYALQ